MLLDLRGVIELPGGRAAFDYSPDLSGAVTGSVTEISDGARATGSVVNTAGIITLNCCLEAKCICICARCLKEFTYPVSLSIKADITEENENANPDGYFITGNEIDVTEIIVSEFILWLDERLLCREDCAGLCQKCGRDLNTGKCGCRADTDPRLAVLEQLLD